AYRVGWPDERLVQGTLETIVDRVRTEGIARQALILVGEVLEAGRQAPRSKLYDAGFEHGFRRGRTRGD
ncbi:MAG: cobalt-precorrin-4 C(11)-methyltransferase, partial [Thermodesulfobacteriota bacterium]|nr:cobalt-precorrin-4 C(11)-methyltransferase [Thermodesulfobacteriota bacterium]